MRYRYNYDYLTSFSQGDACVKTQKDNMPAAALERLRDGERRGEVVSEARSNFGPLPVVKLSKPVRLKRIVKSAKR